MVKLSLKLGSSLPPKEVALLSFNIVTSNRVYFPRMVSFSAKDGMFTKLILVLIQKKQGMQKVADNEKVDK